MNYTQHSTLAVEEVIHNSSHVVVLLQQLLIQVAIRESHAHQPVHEISGFFRRCPLCLWRCVLLWKLESRRGRSVITTVSFTLDTFLCVLYCRLLFQLWSIFVRISNLLNDFTRVKYILVNQICTGILRTNKMDEHNIGRTYSEADTHRQVL